MKRPRVFRSATVVGTGLAATMALAACWHQRGEDAIPIDRRHFHEVPPPEMTFATPVDAGPEEASVPDASKPATKPAAPKSEGAAWAAPKSGYLEQLGSEFRRLRPMPMTEYDVHHSKGRKRAVMNELGRHLVRASRDNVIRIMGAPDAAPRPGSGQWGPTRKQDGRAAERLIYLWRGWKDYLLFELDSGGNVLRSEWMLSTE